MGYSVARKLIESHLVEGEMIPGRENRNPHRPDAHAGCEYYGSRTRSKSSWISSPCSADFSRATSFPVASASCAIAARRS